MSVELRPEQVERLLALEAKFAREGLTFDDVLLVPAESSVLPAEVSTRTRLTRRIELEIPVVVGGDGHRHRGARWRSRSRARAGSASLHRNLSIDAQVAEVDKVKRSEAGMIVDPSRCRPTRLVADALALMERYRISGVPIVRRRRPARRDPHQPRSSFRGRRFAAGLEPDDRSGSS